MKTRTDEYRPYYAIEFNFSTSLTKSDAILAMLGWQQKPLREITEAASELDHQLYCGYPISDEEGLILNPPTPSLFEILTTIKESADSDFGDAIVDQLAEDIVQEKLDAIKQSHLLIETAHKFYCFIEDELTKGELSALRIDQSKTTDPQAPFITTASLSEWAKAKFAIDVFPQAHITLSDLNVTQQEIEASIAGDLNANDAINLQITFASLVKAFAKINKEYHHSDGNPKVDAISKEISSQAKKNLEDLPGQADRTIKDRIKIAINTQVGMPSMLTRGTVKNFRITLALLCKALANKLSDFKKPDGEPDITKIAEHLATAAKESSGQDQQSITQRLEEALEILKNPDKRKS